MKSSYLMITLTFIGGLILAMLPLPYWAEEFRPDWVALVLIYWCMSSPNQIGIAWAFTIGIIADVAMGSLLGQHALGYVTIAFLVVKQHQRMRVYPLMQQSIIVFVLLLIQQIEILWIKGIVGEAPDSLIAYFTASLTGALLWTWTFLVLRELRRKFSAH